MGSAGDRGLSELQTGRRENHEKGSRQELDLRVHRIAATGSRMDIRIQECNAGIHSGSAWDHATDQQVWRSLSVQQSDGGGRGIHWHTPRVSEPGARGRLRRSDAAKDFRSAGDEVDDIRLCACSRRQPCEPARGRCGWQAHRGQHGVQLLDRASPSRRWRLDLGPRPDALCATRACAWKVA